MRLAALIALSVSLLGLVGCGGPAGATASGKVTYGGEPVADGAIVFQPADKQGGPAKARIIDGKYMLDEKSGLTAGAYYVQIHGFRKGNATEQGPGDESLDDPDLAITENAGPPTDGDANAVSYIPPKYNATTELKKTIQPGQNPDLDFDLEAASNTYPTQ